MNRKWVATPYARKMNTLPQNKINWGWILLICILLWCVSCTKNDDLETFGDEITGVKKAPVAKPGSNQTIILPTNFVNLDGSASTDSDNIIVSYSWAKVSGPDSYTFTDANAVKTQVKNL